MLVGADLDLGDRTAFEGHHVQAERPLNSPTVLTKPHPPILIGGSGEKKTLRYVARYAQACNLFPGPELPRKLDVLREHCATEGRDYDDIEKTVIFRFDVGPNGEHVDSTLEQLRGLAELGIDTAIGGVRDVSRISPLEIIGRDIIPEAAKF